MPVATRFSVILTHSLNIDLACLWVLRSDMLITVSNSTQFRSAFEKIVADRHSLQTNGRTDRRTKKWSANNHRAYKLRGNCGAFAYVLFAEEGVCSLRIDYNYIHSFIHFISQNTDYKQNNMRNKSTESVTIRYDRRD